MPRFMNRIAAVSIGITALVGLTLALPSSVTAGPRSSSGVAWAAALSIGDPAPAMAVKAFVKGEPVSELPKGKISVVEFWATWCGPCKMSIPHLTEMAKKYPDVTFVGVSVWEQDQSLVAPFVKEMGDKMDYHVAMDVVPDGGKGMDGTMAKTWMAAAEQNGIPTAFVVGKDGRIAWIGHPMAMEEPLAKITAGNWDVAAAKVEMQKQQESQQQMMALNTELRTAMQSKDPNKILAVVDGAISKFPNLEMNLGVIKFQQLLVTSPVDALNYGAHLVNDVDKGNSVALNGVAWSVVDPEAKVKMTPKLAAFALRTAKLADDAAGGKDGDIVDTLAAALHADGDNAGAATAEKRAIDLLSKGPQSPQLVAEIAQMKKQLDVYNQSALANK